MSSISRNFMLSFWLQLLLLLGRSNVLAQTYTVVNDTTYEDEDVFRQDILNTTNWFREQYNASELVWNNTLAEFAEDVVDSCRFEHSGGPYGENLAAGYTNASAAIGAWGNESEIYNFDDPGFSEETGHFTQLVWTNTTSVGCARKNCTGEDGEKAAPGWFVVCEYYPRGNFRGQYEDNVNKPKDGMAASLYSHPDILLRTSIAVLSALLAFIVF